MVESNGGIQGHQDSVVASQTASRAPNLHRCSGRGSQKSDLYTNFWGERVGWFPTPDQVVKFDNLRVRWKDSHHRDAFFLKKRPVIGHRLSIFSPAGVLQARHGHDGTCESHDEASPAATLRLLMLPVKIFGAPISFASI